MPLHDDRCISSSDMQKQNKHAVVLVGACVQVFYVSTPSSLPQVLFFCGRIVHHTTHDHM
jgi:hypothetical protein